MDIDYINKTANKTLQDMLSKDYKQFNLKDKESIIINNPSNFKKFENNKIDFNLGYKIQDCIKVVMVNGELNKELSDKIPKNYYIDSINNSKSLSKVACPNCNPVIANNTANFKNGLYIESKEKYSKPIYIIKISK